MLQQRGHQLPWRPGERDLDAAELAAPEELAAAFRVLSQYGLDVERVDHHVQMRRVGRGGEDFAADPERRIAPMVRL